MKIVMQSKALIWIIILYLIIFTCSSQHSLRSSQILKIHTEMLNSLTIFFSYSWAHMLNFLSWHIRWISSYFSNTKKISYLYVQFRHLSCAQISIQQLTFIENLYVSRMMSFIKILALNFLLLLLQKSSNSAV